MKCIFDNGWGFRRQAAGIREHRDAAVQWGMACRVWFCFILVISSVTMTSAGAVASLIPATEFRAGAAASKITPPVGSIMGNSYGITVSEGVHDDLYARALVFEYNGKQTALVSIDLVSIPHEVVMRTCELISYKTGIPASHVMLSATHLHAGPQLNPLFWDAVGGAPKQKSLAYTSALPSLIAESVENARKKMKPVRLSAGRVAEDELSFNRRYLMADGTFRMNPGRMNPGTVRPVGPIDPEVSIVYVESLDSRPVALLVNFALHVAVVTGNHFSADFPGKIAEQIKTVLGDEVVTIFAAGTSGNVNHLDLRHEKQLAGQTEASRIGIVLAADVLRAMQNLHPVDASGLNMRSETVLLPVATADTREAKRAVETIRNWGRSGGPAFRDVVSAWRTIDLGITEGDEKMRHAVTTTVPVVGGSLKSEVKVMTVGRDLALVGFPGDAFVELGLDIKLNSPFPFTLVAEQSGNGALSYVPNHKAFSEMGYEVASARFLPGGGELLVDAVLRNLISLYPYQRDLPSTAPLRSGVDPVEIDLFNGKDLKGWYTYLKGRGKNVDPKKVFTVKNKMIRISGEEWGCITTDEEYENYKITIEYKWGDKTFAPREDRARDSGLLLHSFGKDGGHQDTWIHSLEVQIIEGGTGDFIVIGGGNKMFSLEVPVAPEKQDGKHVFDPKGTPVTIGGGRINWYGRDPEWKDLKGFRGKNDVENAVGEWNRLECVADGETLSVYLNGNLVNYASRVSPTKGKIQIQSESAEMFIRKITLTPITGK